jgi:hypothetical protein
MSPVGDNGVQPSPRPSDEYQAAEIQDERQNGCFLHPFKAVPEAPERVSTRPRDDENLVSHD